MYGIVDRDKKQIHSTSFQIDATFSIANEQLGTHNGSDATQKYLKVKCEDLGVTQNCDKNGFYMGSDSISLGLIDHLSDDDQLKQTYANLDLMIPYERYSIPTDVFRTSLTSIPII